MLWCGGEYKLSLKDFYYVEKSCSQGNCVDGIFKIWIETVCWNL